MVINAYIKKKEKKKEKRMVSTKQPKFNLKKLTSKERTKAQLVERRK